MRLARDALHLVPRAVTPPQAAHRRAKRPNVWMGGAQLNVQLENIPDELKARPQWVTHKKKIPFNPRTGKAADTTDPATWGTFDEAYQAAQRRHHAGIGYVFSPDDPYVGIDLDDCSATKARSRSEHRASSPRWTAIARRVRVGPASTSSWRVTLRRASKPNRSRCIPRTAISPSPGSSSPAHRQLSGASTAS